MRALASLAVISAALFAVSCGDNGDAAGRGAPDAGGGGGLCPVPIDCANPACASNAKCQPGGGDGGIDGGLANATCGDGKVDNGEVCDDGNTANWDGCDNACTQSVFTYVKASNANPGDTLGASVAISADGSTLVVGAPQEASNATGVGGDQTNNAAKGAGAVYVYVRAGSAWTQQAYLKASNTGINDQFGFSVAVSADGSTIAVGATEEDSADPADPANNAAVDAGAVYMFARANGAWTQQAYVKETRPRSKDLFGVAVAGDGKTLAVGAVGEDGSATGVNGTPDTAAEGAGAAYVFTVNGGAWTQQAYVKASNTGAGDSFGISVALSNDGATLAVGADHEASGLVDNQGDNSASAAGAAYVFALAGGQWSQQAYVKTDSPQIGDRFGTSISLSGDGATLAVGAELALIGKGAAFVYARSGVAWSQSASLKPSNAGGLFGNAIALSADGSRVAIGASNESSNATGVGGDPGNTGALLAGATYVFAAAGKSWNQQSYVKAFNTDAGDFFGTSVSLSGDGGLLAVGAWLESSNATGINGNQVDNSANESGAVYIYQ
jgi:cysteine-rich repeat protein